MPATSFEGCWLSQNDSAETQGLNSKNARPADADSDASRPLCTRNPLSSSSKCQHRQAALPLSESQSSHMPSKKTSGSDSLKQLLSMCNGSGGCFGTLG